jgi:hypothetical protein
MSTQVSKLSTRISWQEEELDGEHRERREASMGRATPKRRKKQEGMRRGWKWREEDEERENGQRPRRQRKVWRRRKERSRCGEMEGRRGTEAFPLVSDGGGEGVGRGVLLMKEGRRGGV